MKQFVKFKTYVKRYKKKLEERLIFLVDKIVLPSTTDASTCNRFTLPENNLFQFPRLRYARFRILCML